MGARTAVAVCKRLYDIQKDAVQGVLCLSFPLNVPGKPQTFVERSRGLLALSQTSVLFVSGTADNMSTGEHIQYEYFKLSNVVILEVLSVKP